MASVDVLELNAMPARHSADRFHGGLLRHDADRISKDQLSVGRQTVAIELCARLPELLFEMHS